MSRYIILALASIGLISIGVVIYFEIGKLYDSFSDDHKYWKREVNALDEPEYSLEAYREFGGEFRMWNITDYVPRIAGHKVKLKFRDWKKLKNEYLRTERERRKKEYDEKILRKRIAIAEDVRKVQE